MSITLSTHGKSKIKMILNICCFDLVMQKALQRSLYKYLSALQTQRHVSIYLERFAEEMVAALYACSSSEQIRAIV